MVRSDRYLEWSHYHCTRRVDRRLCQQLQQLLLQFASADERQKAARQHVSRKRRRTLTRCNSGRFAADARNRPTRVSDNSIHPKFLSVTGLLMFILLPYYTIQLNVDYTMITFSQCSLKYRLYSNWWYLLAVDNSQPHFFQLRFLVIYFHYFRQRDYAFAFVCLLLT